MLCQQATAGGAHTAKGAQSLVVSLWKRSPEDSRKMKDMGASVAIRKCEIRGKVAIFGSDLLR